MRYKSFDVFLHVAESYSYGGGRCLVSEVFSTKGIREGTVLPSVETEGSGLVFSHL